MCLERNVSTLIVGDVKHIRNNLDYGRKANQKLHQWAHGTFRRMIEYKARLAGMEVRLIGESYTSRTCPMCDEVKKSKPNGRVFYCPACGFRYHRDGVGAVNIRQKYLEEVSEKEYSSNSGYGIPLWGIQFHENTQCSSSSRNKTPLGATA